MTLKKWLSVFVYLLASCAFGMNIFVVLLLYGVRFFSGLCLMYHLKFILMI